VSYYTKGAVVAWLLDAEVRRASGGTRSLDDVMRLAFARYSGASGFRHGEFRAAAAEVAGEDLSAFFRHALETTGELDFRPALAWLGLRFTSRPEKGEEVPPADRGWLGLTTEERAGLLVVTEVPRETPGYAAGVNVDDEVLALDGYRVTAAGWAKRLEVYRPGQQAELLVARRERLVELPVTFGTEPQPAWLLEPDPGATAEQRAHLDAWLAGG
jgi:predicted metalloprotease with PDZ domain